MIIICYVSSGIGAGLGCQEEKLAYKIFSCFLEKIKGIAGMYLVVKQAIMKIKLALFYKCSFFVKNLLYIYIQQRGFINLQLCISVCLLKAIWKACILLEVEGEKLQACEVHKVCNVKC